MRTSAELLSNLLADCPILQDHLTSDVSVRTARRIWQANALVKKYIVETDAKADSQALTLFVACNEKCRKFVLSPSFLFGDVVVGEVKTFFNDVMYCGPEFKLTISRLFEGFGLGPGANIKVDSFDFYSKLFNSPLSRTSDWLYRMYRYAIVESPRWISAELKRSAHRGDAIVAGSRLSFVPKTQSISRTICTEPTLNMLFQKGIGAFLEDGLRERFKINLSKQPELNRMLARRGSIDGSFGTIDLSSASDSISVELCRELLPDEFFRWLLWTRSPVTILPDGTQVKLDMISSMGNAFTFPLQTMIFASLVVSCYRVLGIKPEYCADGPTNFAVFGDDIIVRKDAYAFVVRCLEMFGFQVNAGKSFNSGGFRESCGGDYFNGHDIRGVYIKDLQHEAHVFSTVNRLLRWAARDGELIPTLVADLLRDCRFLTVPYQAGDAEGIKVPFSAAKRTQWHKATQSIVYHALVAEPVKFSVPFEEGQRCRLPGFMYNGSGLLLAMLGGYIRDGWISVRSNRYRAKVRRRFTSSWEYIPAADLKSQDYGWKTIVNLHLTMLDLG